MTVCRVFLVTEDEREKNNNSEGGSAPPLLTLLDLLFSISKLHLHQSIIQGDFKTVKNSFH